jgi:hypothetical protein
MAQRTHTGLQVTIRGAGREIAVRRAVSAPASHEPRGKDTCSS